MKALKNILRRQQASHQLIASLCDSLKVRIAVISDGGRLLFGQPDPSQAHSFPISENGSHVAVLKSDKTEGQQIADLINVLATKELEKRKIGSEVLGLYREINMIYDFSEKISEKIDIHSLAQIALQEAGQIIDSSHGRLFLYAPEDDEIKIAASFGPAQDDPPYDKEQDHLLRQIIERGTSAIVPYHELVKYPLLGFLKTLMYAPLKVKNRTLGILMLGSDEETEFTAAALKLLTTVSLQTASAIESVHLYEKGLQEAREREEAIRKIHDISTKFVPYEFIHSLGKKTLTEINLGDQVERKVTVMFCDIRDFTSFSEALAPEDNFLFINAFNKRMGPIVRKNNGFINQYLGDGFMAIFPGKTIDALKAAVEMHRSLEAYNVERQEKNWRAIRMGVGMQTGKLIMGITGDIERMEAATISDTVNTAARIEGLSKHYGTSILLTGDCMSELNPANQFDFRYLGLVQVKGRKKPLEIFECINGDPGDLYGLKIETLGIFDEGMEQYFKREFAMSALTFQQVLKQNPADKTARLFLNRSANLITQELSEDWRGVETMQLK